MELTHIEKYYEKIQEKYPDLTIKQIDKIVKYGMRSFYLHNLYGGDVLLKSPYFTLYNGKVFSSNLVFYKYWVLKNKIKLRIKYKRNKTKYSGYYYFGLTDNEFEKYKAQFKKTGRRRKWISFDKLKAYKILEECILDHRFKHIFKFEYPEDVGFSFYNENIKIKNLEYIYKVIKNNKLEPMDYEGRNN